jgi:PAS domain S-box-containing protein
MVTDPAGSLQLVNERFLEMFAVPQQAFLQGDEAALLGAVRNGVQDVQAFDQLLGQSDEGPAFQTIAMRDGRIIECHSRSRVDEKGGVLSFRDVTARRMAEHALRESEDRYRGLVEGATDVIYTVARDNTISSLNAAFETLFSVARSAWVGRSFIDLVDEIDRGKAQAAFDNAFEYQKISLVELRCTPAHGHEVRTLEVTVIPNVVEGTVVGAEGVARDVTARKLLEKQLEQERRVGGLGRLAATMAHEFNNVLMGIQPFIELIERQGQGTTVRNAISRIGRAIERGKRITQEILRFTQPAEPVLQPIAVGPWMTAVVEDLRPLMGKAIEVDLWLPRQPVFVNGDASQLAQVITNFILNARDAMDGQGRIVVDVSRNESDADGGAWVQISITDSGSGMPPEVVDRIFEPLYTTKKSGTGLGLAVAHQVVLRHRGRIKVESEPGFGTTFNVILPAASAPMGAETVSEPQAALPRPRNVLIIDDNPEVADGLRYLLEGYDFKVRVAGRGFEGLDMLRAELPEAVILDVTLPDIDGISLYAMMLPEWPDLPVIFSSGHADLSGLQKRFPGRKLHLLVKPYDISALFEKLEEACAPAQHAPASSAGS